MAAAPASLSNPPCRTATTLRSCATLSRVIQPRLKPVKVFYAIYFIHLDQLSAIRGIPRKRNDSEWLVSWPSLGSGQIVSKIADEV